MPWSHSARSAQTSENDLQARSPGTHGWEVKGFFLPAQPRDKPPPAYSSSPARIMAVWANQVANKNQSPTRSIHCGGCGEADAQSST